eukprot:gnl/MRDRNA2_/MRDRNA2_30712_c0_seq1.p1 gnl/MRDRNA2_/MRDRNA2_30712_c0~~gnl/MRDRNA2_/MRDRNA2_30712_c0_seq1.p1  ORF type:complete len:160 (-),score=35.87 gnl/MRDRNA2_/MRDRNA2_30712_c0_seq1:682-1161(-)
MRNSFAGSLIVLCLHLVFALSRGSNVRTHGSEMAPSMHQKLQAEVQAVSKAEVHAVSIDSHGRISGTDGKFSAVRKHSAEMHCKNIATFEGCLCDNRPIGTGITGNFVNDSVAFESFELVELAEPDSFWQYTAFHEGEEVKLEKFKKGKLTLIANVASA